MLSTATGGPLRTLRLSAAMHSTKMLQESAKYGEIWPRNEDLTPTRDYDSPSMFNEMLSTTFIKPSPQGEDTDGVASQVPSLNSMIPVPRVPPDPWRTRVDIKRLSSGQYYSVPLSIKDAIRSKNAKQSIHGDDTEVDAEPIESCSNPPNPFPRELLDTSPTATSRSLRPRNYDLRLSLNEIPRTMFVKQSPQGEDTDGVASQVPSLNSMIPVPRVPPDPSWKGINRPRPLIRQNTGEPPMSREARVANVKQPIQSEDTEGAEASNGPSSNQMNPIPRVPPDSRPTATNLHSSSPAQNYNKVRGSILHMIAKRLPIGEGTEGEVLKVSSLTSATSLVENMTSLGDDTEGVMLRVPRSAPTLPQPRVPPDRQRGWAKGRN